MKKYLKIKLALAVMMITILAFNMTAFASTTTTYNNEATSGSIAITAVVDSTYSVTLPASLELAYNNSTKQYEGTYTVGVKANLTSNEYVTVTPDSEVTLTNNNIDETTVTGGVTQTVNTWRLTKSSESATNEIVSNFTQYVETTGTVTADITQAGSYAGNLNFTFHKGSDTP